MEIREELIRRIYELKQQLEENEAKLSALKEEAVKLESELQELDNRLLQDMSSTNDVEVKVDNLVAQYFCKNEFSYGDEKALLNYLIEKGMVNYLTTKHSTVLNKTALKKDLKTDAELKESLKDFVGDKKVEYVVVTTEENHQRMLEHIEAGRKK